MWFGMFHSINEEIPWERVPYLSALESCVHDKVLYKFTFTFRYIIKTTCSATPERPCCRVR